MKKNNLKLLREELGLSQSQLAELCDMSVRTLQDYEQGHKDITSAKGSVLYRISTALGCQIADLIVEKGEYEGGLSVLRALRYFSSFQDLFKLDQNTIPNTPFDDVFKTLSIDCIELMIPVVNEAFGEHYEARDLISLGNNEHISHRKNGEIKKNYSDSNFIILSKNGEQKRYNVECQSTVDNSILLRIFEYASQIAHEGAYIIKDRIKISYPRSALIYLRHNSETPDYMKVCLDTPGGEVSWDVPVIKTQTYSLDEIFEKRLFFFIPYYILGFENELASINSSREKIKKLKGEYEEIRLRMDQMVSDKLMNEYENITIRSMCYRVLDYVTYKYSAIKEEVLGTMGGQVLEYEAKDILNQGKSEGRREGRREGRQEGRIEERSIIAKLSSKMRALGRSEEFMDSIQDEKLLGNLLEEFGL